MDKVNHFELHADDVERAKKFYKDVFGWHIEKAQMPGPDYHMITTVPTDENQMPKEVGAINGGMQKRSHPAETTVVVINVSNLQEALEKVKNSGGKVVMPETKMGDMGLYARVHDTEGNLIGIWQNVSRTEKTESTPAAQAQTKPS